MGQHINQFLTGIMGQSKYKIGVYLNQEKIYITKSVGSFPHLQLETYDIFTCKENQNILECLESALHQIPASFFHSGKVYVCLSFEKFSVEKLTLPSLSDIEVNQAIHHKMESHPESSYIYKIVSSYENDQNQRMNDYVIYYSQKEYILHLMEIFCPGLRRYLCRRWFALHKGQVITWEAED